MPTRVESLLVELVDFEAGVRDLERLVGRAGVAHASGVRLRLANVALDLRPASSPPREGVLSLRLARSRAEPAPPLSRESVSIELVDESEDLEPKAASEAIGEGGAGAPASPLALDHVVIATADPERVRRDLGEALGIRLALDRSFPERGLRLLFFRLGGVTLEVAARIASAGEGERLAQAGRDGDAFQGLAFRVLALEAERERLLRAGFDLSEIRSGHKPGTRVLTVRAPVHGIPTLLIEHPPR